MVPALILNLTSTDRPGPRDLRTVSTVSLDTPVGDKRLSGGLRSFGARFRSRQCLTVKGGGGNCRAHAEGVVTIVFGKLGVRKGALSLEIESHISRSPRQHSMSCARALLPPRNAAENASAVKASPNSAPSLHFFNARAPAVAPGQSPVR